MACDFRHEKTWRRHTYYHLILEDSLCNFQTPRISARYWNFLTLAYQIERGVVEKRDCLWTAGASVIKATHIHAAGQTRRRRRIHTWACSTSPPFSKWVVLYKYITEEPKLWGVELWRSIWKSRAAATKTRSSWCRTPNEYLLRMFGAWARLLLRVLHTSPSLQRTPQSKFSHHRLKTSGSIFRVKSQTTKQKREDYT